MLPIHKQINILIIGAWGYNFFQDDAALAFMAAIEHSDQPKILIDQALQSALIIDYLETDEANAIIVAAAYIDRQINGTKFSSPLDAEPLPVDTFPEKNPEVDLSSFKLNAQKMLQRVLSDGSKLNELWAESADYDEWRKNIKDLINRLK